MAKIPDKPQDIFAELTKDYLKIFDRELVSLILYGSAASGHYVKGKSDINLLVVLTLSGMDRLPDLIATVRNWRKRRVAVPLAMTADFILASLDSYPIEFLNMKNSHILIYGEDILDSLIIKPEDLRLQMERELRGKLVLLRQGYLEVEGKPGKLRGIISNSITAFISIFNAMLYLKQKKAPQGRRNTIREMGTAFAADTTVFNLCADIKEGVDRLSNQEITSIFDRYVKEVDRISTIADRS